MKPVEVSGEAIFNLQKISDFLQRKWSSKTAFKFTAALEKAFESIARNPKSFPYSPKLKLRKFLVMKQTILLYREYDNRIVIVQAFDARQNYQDQEKWK